MERGEGRYDRPFLMIPSFEPSSPNTDLGTHVCHLALLLGEPVKFAFCQLFFFNKPAHNIVPTLCAS